MRGFPVHVFDLLYVSEEDKHRFTRLTLHTHPESSRQPWPRSMARNGPVRTGHTQNGLPGVCVRQWYLRVINWHTRVTGLTARCPQLNKTPHLQQTSRRWENSNLCSRTSLEPTRQSNLVTLNVSSSLAHQSCGVRVVFMSSNWRHCSECCVSWGRAIFITDSGDWMFITSHRCIATFGQTARTPCSHFIKYHNERSPFSPTNGRDQVKTSMKLGSQ